MLKKKQRLSRSEFANLLKHGKRLHGKYFSLLYTPADEIKCGLVVGKKIAKKAVERNKLRRKLYAVFGENLAVMPQIHCAVVTRPLVTTLSHQELKNEVETLLGTIK